MTDPGKLHKDYLGMDVPEGYFIESKRRILENLPFENKQEPRIFGLRRMVAYLLAASILLLVSIGIGLQYNSQSRGPEPGDRQVVEAKAEPNATEEFLLTSLLVEDSEIDRFTNDYLISQVVIEAELSEQELENIFINSLFVDDTLVSDYLEQSLVDQIVM